MVCLLFKLNRLFISTADESEQMCSRTVPNCPRDLRMCYSKTIRCCLSIIPEGSNDTSVSEEYLYSLDVQNNHRNVSTFLHVLPQKLLTDAAFVIVVFLVLILLGHCNQPPGNLCKLRCAIPVFTEWTCIWTVTQRRKEGYSLVSGSSLRCVTYVHISCSLFSPLLEYHW